MTTEIFKRAELVEKVATAANLSKQKAEDLVTMTFTWIKDALMAGKDFRIPVIGGTLRKVPVAARTARNPRTGELVQVPEKWKFKYNFKAVKQN